MRKTKPRKLLTDNHKKTLNFLRYRKGYTFEQGNGIILGYGAFKLPSLFNTSEDMARELIPTIADAIQQDWNSFMKYFKTHVENKIIPMDKTTIEIKEEEKPAKKFNLFKLFNLF